MILVEKDINLIKHQDLNYILEDHQVVVKDAYDNIKFIFGDLNKNTAYIADISHIDSFISNKYIYEDGEVVLNPDWVEPEV